MSCLEIRIQIAALVDGALDAPEEQAVQAHLGTCPACSEFHREQLELNEFLTQHSFELAPPTRIWARIEADLTTGSQKGGWLVANWLELFRIPVFQQAFAALALALVLSLGLFSLNTPVDRQMLAQVEAFELDVQGNPFVVQPERDNPFFTAATKENPFEAIGRQQ